MGKTERDRNAADFSPGRGRSADRPSQIPAAGWKDVIWRVYGEIGRDRITLVAAGVTFYLLLALFPALAAFVSLYGFVAEPSTIADHISYLGGLMPPDGLELLRAQLDRLASRGGNALSIGFVIGFLFALWSANSGVKTLFDALNIAYEEKEKRGIIGLHLLSFGFTLAAMFIGILLIVSVGVVPAVLSFLSLERYAEMLIRILRWPMTFLVVAMGISVIYRYGPSRERAKWRWITWGSGLATLVWFTASFAFSFYLQNFASYDATYGSLGAIIGFMMWTWISVMVLLVGAEINAEMEHQTARDSTSDEPEPFGERGAVMADTLGRTSERGSAR